METKSKDTLSELLFPNNTNCFKEELIEFDEVVPDCKCPVCIDKKIDKNHECLTIIKRIVIPADTKNENDISDGICEKIKIKIPFDSSTSMGK